MQETKFALKIKAWSRGTFKFFFVRGGGGTPHYGPYEEVPPKGGGGILIFFMQASSIWKGKVRISLVEEYERVGKSVISFFKKV